VIFEVGIENNETRRGDFKPKYSAKKQTEIGMSKKPIKSINLKASSSGITNDISAAKNLPKNP